MAVPGVRVTSARRTVGVAVALVTGQALLCGVIGFLTFGGGPAPAAQTAEPQLAVPPLVVPSVSTAPAGEPAKRPRPQTIPPARTQRPASPPATVTVRSATTRPVSPTRTHPAPAQPPPPPVPPTDLPPLPTTRAVLPSASSPPVPGADKPAPPVVDQECDDLGATGRTVDGKAVRCDRDGDGALRWRLV